LEILENEVLPTARKWSQMNTGLSSHARKTLAYWGEYEEPNHD